MKRRIYARMTNYRFYAFFIIAMIAISSCKKQEHVVVPSSESKVVTVEEAKTWLSQNDPNLKLGDNWNQTRLINDGDGASALKVPIDEKKSKDGKTFLLSDVLFKKNGDGTINAYVYRVIVDKEYFNAKPNALLAGKDKREYIDNIDFTGTIALFTINGAAIKGRKFKNGVPIADLVNTTKKINGARTENWMDYDQYGRPINPDGDTGSEWDLGTLKEVEIHEKYKPWSIDDPKYTDPKPKEVFQIGNENGNGDSSAGSAGEGDDGKGKAKVERNGEKDPDWPSDCNSFAFTPTAKGDYQVCGVTDLRFDFTTEYVNNRGKVEFDYFRATYDVPVYFEFPRVRSDGTFISSRDAARITAGLKDKAEEIMESQVENSPPPSNSVEMELLLQRYIRILQAEIKVFGGRATFKNNYNTTSIKHYSKSIGGC